MRYRLMATYDGSPFEAGIGPTGDDIVLFAACPPPEELGFEPATGHWRKRVRFSQIQAVWESRPVGVFRGERCLVLDDLGDRLHIGYLGHDEFRARRLGYWQVDRGVFELIAPRTEVTDILEERVDLPRPAAPATPADPQPAPAQAGGHPAEAGWEGEHPSGPIGLPGRQPGQAHAAPPEVPVPDGRTGVSLPAPPAEPLPLEAEAMRATSASRQHEEAASHAGDQPAAGQRPATRLSPVPADPPLSPVPAGPPLAAVPTAPGQPTPSPRLPRAARRMDTEQLFADLASLAGIPASSYAVGAEVEGAMCLVETEAGFEVFIAADGARHELQAFTTEESACFYLFGVLAAEAVRTGELARVPDGEPGWQSRTA